MPSVGGHTFAPLKSAPKNDFEITGPLLVAVLTVSVSDLVASCCGDDASLACTETLNCPVCVVVPEMDPLLNSVSPDGSIPLEMDHLYGVLPPLACSVSE
jgi:hypothetical protein